MCLTWFEALVIVLHVVGSIPRASTATVHGRGEHL